VNHTLEQSYSGMYSIFQHVDLSACVGSWISILFFFFIFYLEEKRYSSLFYVFWIPLLGIFDGEGGEMGIVL